jgi:MOSC domain-containing protein YiiM
MSLKLISITVGKPKIIENKGKKVETAIWKNPAPEPIMLSELNFEGDAQADLIHHGGKDKAVCVYSADHFPYWENELGITLYPGAFGENLTIKGLTEKDICIGDIFQLGEAVVQVSQPRQPCFKLGMKYNMPSLPVLMQKNLYTGFYCRVLQAGFVTKDKFFLIEPHPKKVTIEFANKVKYIDKQDIEAIKKVLEVEPLSEEWYKSLSKRLVNTK